MAVVNEDRKTGLPIPRGRDACRVLLIREAEQIRTFIAERWSYESIRLWLLERYGAAFDIPLPAFRERVRRALQVKTEAVLKGQADAIQAVRVADQAKEKESDPVKEHRLTWEERRTGRFPGSGTNVVHRKKPNRDELY
mgnify:FL=1